jgi:hypothetical protein
MGNVDRVFWQRLFQLIRIVIPSWASVEIIDLALLTAFLIVRTYLSIYISTLNGRIVRTIVERNFANFFKKVLFFSY